MPVGLVGVVVIGVDVLSGELAYESVIWSWDVVGGEYNVVGLSSAALPPLAKLNRSKITRLPAHELICRKGAPEGVSSPGKFGEHSAVMQSTDHLLVWIMCIWHQPWWRTIGFCDVPQLIFHEYRKLHLIGVRVQHPMFEPVSRRDVIEGEAHREHAVHTPGVS